MKFSLLTREGSDRLTLLKNVLSFGSLVLEGVSLASCLSYMDLKMVLFLGSYPKEAFLTCFSEKDLRPFEL